MANNHKFRDRLPYPLRVIHGRPRLFGALLLGAIATVLLPADWRLASRALVGWDVAVWIYLVLAYRLISVCETAGMPELAADEDEGRLAILVLTVVAALATLIAIVFELSNSHGERDGSQLVLAIVTILSSWFFIHTIFALHYAHEFYGEGGKRGGLKFPHDDKPDYWDFVYFSFVIGMTSQVSDVQVTSKPTRRTVNAHGIVSFVFNAALVALTVNIAASAI